MIGLDPHHLSYEKGPADFDIRHSWSFNALYEFPSPGIHGVGRVLDGWRMGTILRALSGQPFSPILSGNRSRSQVEAGSAQDRPDLVAGRKPSNIVLGGPDRYFDPLAFAIQPVGLLGTSSRNILQGPGQASLDLSFAKELRLSPLGEGGHLEFRADRQSVV